MQAWWVSVFSWTLQRLLSTSLQVKYKVLLHARSRCVYVGGQYWTLSLCTAFSLGHIDFENKMKHSPKGEKEFPNCCFPHGDAKESLCSPSLVLLVFLLSGSCPLLHGGAPEPRPTENYSSSLSTAPSQSIRPSLCSLLQGPFPSSSPSGAARKESSVTAPWRENGGIHPTLCRW